MINQKFFMLRTSTRHFLMLVVFAISAMGSMHLFERILLKQVQEVTEAANVSFTRFFVNETWAELRPLLNMEAKTATKSNPLLGDAEMRVRRFAKGTDLVKVKIYNLQGLTVYSSDHAQIGEDKTKNKGFQSALHGRVVSETNYRGRFGSFDGEVYDRNLVSSYVPVRGMQGIEAVVEVYADRTRSVESVEAQIRSAWWYFGPSLAAAFLMFWLLERSKAIGRVEFDAQGESLDQSKTSDLDTRAHLLSDAAHFLDADRKVLGAVLLKQGDSAPDLAAWQAMREPLLSLLNHVEAFCLIHQSRPAKSVKLVENQPPLGELLDSDLAVFREFYAAQGIEISGSLAPQLAKHRLNNSRDVALLVKLLLRDAVQHNGPGKIRLNIQPDQEGWMQIEVIGTRTTGSSDKACIEAVDSLDLSAARSLVMALNGRLERTSITSLGPWFSARLPVTT